MKKKALSLLLALVMCLGLLPVTAFAATGDYSGACGDGVSYRFDSATGTLTISGSGKMEREDYYDGFGLSGPHYVPYWPWESENAAFDGRDLVTSVVIEEGVTNVGDNAFRGFKKLTRVTIPGSVTSIEGSAFWECPNLATVTFQGSGLTSIGENAFYFCSSLNRFDIPSGVTSIGTSAFRNCTSLAHVTIPASVTSIGFGAFNNCSSLTSVTIPNGVTKLDRTFVGCKNLTSITLPASVTSITIGSFSSCNQLKDVYYQGTAAQWKAIDGSDSLERSGYTIHFTDVPDTAISVSPGSLSVQMEEGGASYIQTVTVNNEGVAAVTLVLPAAKYFDVSVGNTYVAAGKSVRLTVRPKAGLAAGSYRETITITTSDGQGSASIDAAVTVTEKLTVPFTDVPEYWYQPVAWAVEKKITTGTSATKFSPNNNCTHIQILTFLYRAVEQVENPSGADMEKAVAWAREKGMLAAGFERNKYCTRAEAVNYIWQAAGKDAASYDGKFTDVPASSPYATAIAWAIENGVTTGTTDTTFSPEQICPRVHIVAFLYRYFGKK